METCWTNGERDRVLAEVVDNLWRYLGRHACAVPAATRLLADLTGLSAESLETLRHLHLLLSEDVIQLIDEALPALLRGLRPVAPPEAVAARVVVRGRIAWGATMAARARRGGGDRTLHVSATPRPQYGTAEARLLVHTLHALARSCARLSALASGGEEGWTALVNRVETAVERARSHRLLATVHVAEATATADLTSCRRSPRQATRTLARVYDHYCRLVERPTLAALVEALRQRVLAPLDDDALYELWALLGAATVFDEAGWTLDVAALVGQAAVPFSYRAPGGTVARLRFGHTPSHWRRASRYCTVFDRYGLAGAVRRPDLIVELQRGRHRRHLLVEVKRTRDPQYIADSIYKVLGYLADFEAVFAGQEGPRALLLLWDGPGVPPSGQQAPDALLLATHHDYRAQLLQWLGAGNP